MVKTTVALPLLLLVLLAGCAGRSLWTCTRRPCAFPTAAWAPSPSCAWVTRSSPSSPRDPRRARLVSPAPRGEPSRRCPRRLRDRRRRRGAAPLREDSAVTSCAPAAKRRCSSTRTASAQRQRRPEGCHPYPRDAQWTLDMLDPPGDPLHVMPSLSGGLDVFWAAGGLQWRSLPGGATSPFSSRLPSRRAHRGPRRGRVCRARPGRRWCPVRGPAFRGVVRRASRSRRRRVFLRLWPRATVRSRC